MWGSYFSGIFEVLLELNISLINKSGLNKINIPKSIISINKYIFLFFTSQMV